VNTAVAEPEHEIVWEASEKQKEFLAANEFEVLFGGAAGGGKTDGLLIDALGLQQDGWENPAYQAIIFRRTYPDLRDIIDRSLEIYHGFCPGAKYDKQEHVWTFPGGGKVEFGHIQRDAERLRYRGRAFAYIGWEEITLWPTPNPYRYLLSRCRVPVGSGLQTYVRGTTNPDGPGFKWVKDYWKIDSTGKATLFDVKVADEETGKEYKRTRRFIPARVEDNPHLGEDYLITLSMMDEEERNALRKGLWMPPKVKGAWWAADIHKARKEGRICKVPYVEGVPVNTFWDLGVNNTTSIWFHQRVALQDRFLLAYEDNSEKLAHYVKFLQDQPYTYGTHYLPHDAGYRRLGKNDTDTWEEMLQELLPNHRFDTLDRIDDVTVGIEQTSQKLSGCYWDEKGCEEGLSALENYRKIWDEEQQVFRERPLKDWTTNYADAFRQFGQCDDLDVVSKPFSRKKHKTSHRTA
jgi:hypothetical protein